MGNETKKLEAEIDALKKRIEYLEQILDQAGIPYDVEQNSEPKAADNSVEADNLMPYIIPETITPKHVNYFYSFFKGRTDVYSKRSLIVKVVVSKNLYSCFDRLSDIVLYLT